MSFSPMPDKSDGRSGVDVFFLNRGLIDGSSVNASAQGERRRLPDLFPTANCFLHVIDCINIFFSFFRRALFIERFPTLNRASLEPTSF